MVCFFTKLMDGLWCALISGGQPSAFLARLVGNNRTADVNKYRLAGGQGPRELRCLDFTDAKLLHQ
jgi:hypothetical protein